MRRIVMMGLLGLGLAACARTVPESNPGVGFGDYATYELERAQREAALSQTIPGAAPLPGTLPVAVAPDAAVPPGGIAPGALAAAGIGTGVLPPAGLPGDLSGGLPGDLSGDLPGDLPAGLPGGLPPGVPAVPPVPGEPADITFAPMGAMPLPDGTLPDAGPNLVDYALNAPNRLGQEWYSRFVLSGQRRSERNCASYRSPDEAQRDFLARGGPDRDPRGIDPDGDGFACGWDPAPFLLAAGQG